MLREPLRTLPPFLSSLVYLYDNNTNIEKLANSISIEIVLLGSRRMFACTVGKNYLYRETAFSSKAFTKAGQFVVKS
jgi:hypothetical protein